MRDRFRTRLCNLFLPALRPAQRAQLSTDTHRARRGFNAVAALVGAALYSLSYVHGIAAGGTGPSLSAGIGIDIGGAMPFVPAGVAVAVAAVVAIDRWRQVAPAVFDAALSLGVLLAAWVPSVGLVAAGGRMTTSGSATALLSSSLSYSPSAALSAGLSASLIVSLILGFGNQVLRVRFIYAFVSTCLTIAGFVFSLTQLDGLGWFLRLVAGANVAIVGGFTLLANYRLERETRLQFIAATDRHAAGGHRMVALTSLAPLPSTATLGEAVGVAPPTYLDRLTGIPDRRYLDDFLPAVLKAAKQNQLSVALLMCDVDDFAQYNEQYGHAAGDDCLRLLVHAVQRKIRSDTDNVLRYEGEKFAVVLQGSDLEDAVHVAERIRHSIEALQIPRFIGKRIPVLTISIGVAAIAPDETILLQSDAGASRLIQRADERLYRAKRAGRNTSCYSDDGVEGFGEHHQRNILADELRRAVIEDEFVPHFQPQMDFRDDRIVAFEALVRWQHPRKGLTMPGEFIELAEQTGMIIPIGEWMLKAACREAATWPNGIRVAVNVSPAQFDRPGLYDAVCAALTDSGLPPGRLELELTENITLNDDVRARETLEQIKALGVTIALDDFGTGYSSLTYLQRMEFDKIKIDRSFVNRMTVDPNSKAIIRAVIYLARGLGMRVIAEGIETVEQLELLRSKGCDGAQGYLIGRPAPGHAVYEMLRQHAQRYGTSIGTLRFDL